MSIFRSLRLCWWITTSVILFSFRCVLVFAADDVWWCTFCRLKHVMRAACLKRMDISYRSWLSYCVRILLCNQCMLRSAWSISVLGAFVKYIILLLRTPIHFRKSGVDKTRLYNICSLPYTWSQFLQQCRKTCNVQVWGFAACDLRAGDSSHKNSFRHTITPNTISAARVPLG